jgi:hypothetical protein
MRRARLYLLFGGVGAACFVMFTVGFDVIARLTIAGEPVSKALSESLYYKGVQPVGTLMLLAPFVAMAGLSAEVAKTSNVAVASIFFAVLAGVLGWLYFWGYWDAQIAMGQRKWTAAALSVGLVPFFSIPLLIVAAIAAGLIAWRFRRRET